MNQFNLVMFCHCKLDQLMNIVHLICACFGQDTFITSLLYILHAVFVLE